jgi:3-deoxy-D-arabino-heptulosonate 7-phosphate (DAHP) synthase
MENTNTKTTATEYIVRSAINPNLILCTNGEFIYEGVIGPGHDIGAKAYKTRRNAEKARGGYQIIVGEAV